MVNTKLAVIHDCFRHVLTRDCHFHEPVRLRVGSIPVSQCHVVHAHDLISVLVLKPVKHFLPFSYRAFRHFHDFYFLRVSQRIFIRSDGHGHVVVLTGQHRVGDGTGQTCIGIVLALAEKVLFVIEIVFVVTGTLLREKVFLFRLRIPKVCSRRHSSRTHRTPCSGCHSQQRHSACHNPLL